MLSVPHSSHPYVVGLCFTPARVPNLEGTVTYNLGDALRPVSREIGFFKDAILVFQM